MISEHYSAEQDRSDSYHNKSNVDNDRLMSQESPATWMELKRLERANIIFLIYRGSHYPKKYCARAGRKLMPS